MSVSESVQGLAAVFELSEEDRYTYFVAESVRQGRVWTLKGAGGFVAFRDEDGRDCFPFWPAPELAEALANEGWADCRAEPLDLPIFMSRWLEGMSRDDRLVSVLSAPDGTAIVADPLELLSDLEQALSAAAPG